MTPLETAAAAALAAVADDDERLVCVAAAPPAAAPSAAAPPVTAPSETSAPSEAAGPAIDPAAAVVAAALPAFGTRVVTVPGPAARPWVAAGLATVGRRPVLLLERGAPVPTTPPLGALVVTSDLAVADALLGAGVSVVQPAWPADVEPLLRAALDGADAVVLRLHAGAAAGPMEAFDAPVFGRPRVLRSGGPVTLTASGTSVGLLADVARMLAGRGAAVTAVDQHTFRPGRGASLTLLDGALVIGTGAEGLPGRVRRVPASGQPRQVMDAVVAAVPNLLPARADAVTEA